MILRFSTEHLGSACSLPAPSASPWVAAAQPAGYKIAEKYTQKSPETQRLCSAGQVRWGNQSGHKHFYQLLLFRYSQWGPANAL